MMTNLKKRVEVLSLEKNIKDIPNLIRSNKHKFIPQFAELDIAESLKYFNARWREVTDNRVRDIEIFNKSISIFNATAEIETKSNGFSYDTLVAHSEVINDGNAWKDLKICNATFVAEDEKVYLYLLGSSASIKSTKGNFFRNNKANRELYGDIEQHLPQYQFENNFFIWIIAQVGNVFSNEGRLITIKDITGWKGNSERNEGKFSGECSRADNDAVTRAFLLSKEVTGVQIHLELNDFRIVFTLYSDGAIEFVSAQCADFSSGNRNPIEDNILLLTIYRFVIPILRKEYNYYISTYGIAGIDKILDENKKSLKDILEI